MKIKSGPPPEREYVKRTEDGWTVVEAHEIG